MKSAVIAAALVVSVALASSLPGSRGPADPALDGAFLVRATPAVAILHDGTLLPFSVVLPAAASSPRPVVLVVHGYGVTGWDYSWIARHLASRGFAVALVETRDPFEARFELWADQTLAALDALARANASPWSGLFGELDLTRVGALGHSYGAVTVLAAAARDPRIRAVAALEPGAVPAYRTALLARAAAVSVPLLVMGGERDTICPPATQVVPVFAAATKAPARLYVEIARGDHLGFLDFWFGPSARPFVEEHAIASRYFTPWLETWLNGASDTDGYTDGRAAARDLGGDLSRWMK